MTSLTSSLYITSARHKLETLAKYVSATIRDDSSQAETGQQGTLTCLDKIGFFFVKSLRSSWDFLAKCYLKKRIKNWVLS